MPPSPLNHVFLTGANGFVGSHVLAQLLQRPSTQIRAAVRSQAKADHVRADFPHASSSSRLSFAIVPDITSPGAFDHAFENADPPFDAVIHTASPFAFRNVSSDMQAEFLDPAIKGTTEILKATKALAPEVKRVVITSSFAAVGDWKLAPDAGKCYTADDWNPTTWNEALNGDVPAAYRGSKKFAEKSAWDFLKNENPHFELVVLNPPMVYGPLAHTIHRVDQLNESNGRIYKQYVNSSKDAPLPLNGLHAYVDVRDLATAHLLACTAPGAAANRRLLVAHGQLSAQQISDALRTRFPAELEHRTPVGPRPGTSSLHKGAYDVDTVTAREVLGLAEMKSTEETFADLGVQLLALESGEGFVTMP